MARACGWCGIRVAGSARSPGVGPLCIECADLRVMDREDANRYLAEAYRDIASLGFALPTPVKVRLSNHLAPTRTVSRVIGLTRYRTGGSAGPGAVTVQVLAGLMPIYYGKTLAHEIGHAWMFQKRGRGLKSQVLSEGFAEYVELRWTQRQVGAQVGEIIRSQLENPDRVYGAGLRRVLASVERYGEEATISSLVREGRLPTGSASPGARGESVLTRPGKLRGNVGSAASSSRPRTPARTGYSRGRLRYGSGTRDPRRTRTKQRRTPRRLRGSLLEARATGEDHMSRDGGMRGAQVS